MTTLIEGVGNLDNIKGEPGKYIGGTWKMYWGTLDNILGEPGKYIGGTWIYIGGTWTTY